MTIEIKRVNMYKITASDLDGTLLTSEHKIPAFTKQVLNQLHQQGKEFIFATGRHHIDVELSDSNICVQLTLFIIRLHIFCKLYTGRLTSVWLTRFLVLPIGIAVLTGYSIRMEC